jgi:hypothetical protein
MSEALRSGESASTISVPGRFRGTSVWQVKFLSAIEADLVGPLLDREDAAQVTVTAAKDELDYTPQTVHRPCSRLRAQIPFASSKFSRARTLLHAKAIAQPAARYMKVGFQNEFPLVPVELLTPMMFHPNFLQGIFRWTPISELQYPLVEGEKTIKSETD